MPPPYYHCVSRCVHRAFLCGDDPVSGKSYEHRRQWIEDKILSLAQVFAIDVAAYAVMHNHYHVLLHIDQQKAEDWSVRKVIEHWHQLFKGHALSQRYINGEALSRAEWSALDELVLEWRKRLADISWFMVALTRPVFRDTCTSMYIAITKRRPGSRVSNKEDNCTGRFWEGRFINPRRFWMNRLLPPVWPILI